MVPLNSDCKESQLATWVNSCRDKILQIHITHDTHAGVSMINNNDICFVHSVHSNLNKNTRQKQKALWIEGEQIPMSSTGK